MPCLRGSSVCPSLWTLLVSLLLLSHSSLVLSQEDQGPFQTENLAAPAKPKRIAVIGAGAGGSSAAYYLRKYADFFSVPVNITVFERSSYVGGRSVTTDVFEDPFQAVEVGASIFVGMNKNLIKASKKFGLNVRGASEHVPKESTHSLGVWDGSKFVFSQRETHFRWWNIFKLLWTYGWSPMRAQSLTKTTVDKFLKLYKWPYFPWKSLSSVVVSTGLVEATWATGAEFLKENHVSETFAREVIQASTRVNYGQNLPLIHGLETMVCMATDDAVSVEGGNWQIFRGMIDASQADLHLDTEVTEIHRNEDDTYRVAYSPSPNRTTERVFDQVVIASPLQFSNVKISPALESPPDAVPYVDLYVSLLATPHKLSPRYFRLPEGSMVPEVVLTTLPEGVDLGARRDGVGPAGFWSISTLRKTKAPKGYHAEVTEADHYVYKIFSPKPLTPEFLARLFGVDEMELYDHNGTSSLAAEGIGGFSKAHVPWHHQKKWQSYPYLYPRVTFEDVKLAPNMWYTSGIENFISTMETSSLSGMNVAALMLSEWITEFEVKLKSFEEH